MALPILTVVAQQGFGCFQACRTYRHPEKKVFLAALLRALLMGFALIATIWMISLLNSGSLLSGSESTGALLGIPASRGH